MSRPGCRRGPHLCLVGLEHVSTVAHRQTILLETYLAVHKYHSCTHGFGGNSSLNEIQISSNRRHRLVVVPQVAFSVYLQRTTVLTEKALMV